MEFATALACEYSIGFGQGYGTLAAEAMAEREVAMISGMQAPGAEKWRSELHLTEEMMDVFYAQDDEEPLPIDRGAEAESGDERR